MQIGHHGWASLMKVLGQPDIIPVEFCAGRLPVLSDIPSPKDHDQVRETRGQPRFLENGNITPWWRGEKRSI